MELPVRRAIESDREDMMRIARLTWGGYDYLPFAFDEWIKDPDCYTFGIEIDGHLVGLNNLRIIDNGRTGWMEGLRVHRDYRKHGLARLLTKHIVKFAEGIGVSRVRYSTDTTNDASLKLGQEVGMQRVFDMGVFWALTDKIEPVGKLGRRLAKADGKALYEQLSSNQDLVLNSTLVFDWKALEVSESSLSALEEKCQFWTTTRSGVLESFSVGLDRKEMKGTEWSFTIYADNNDAFLSHLAYQLSYARRHKYKGAMGIYPLQLRKALLASPLIPRGSRKRFALTLLEKQFIVNHTPS
jgi:GNAT superfamily N-acetyltransferase